MGRPFGTTRDGRAVQIYDLANEHGLEARVTNYGATLVEMWVPDRDGKRADVVLGFEDVSGYESEANQYFGCTAGRVANRIAGSEFELDGTTYSLAANDGPNHLHGGVERSLDKVVWRARDVSGRDGPAIRFDYTSPDMEEGYPGRLTVRVTYSLTRQDELRIDYRATTDRRTPVNLTHHSYWNLGGQGRGTILDDELTVFADHYTPTDDGLIPTGAIDPVAGTPLDFRRPTAIGARIEALVRTAARGYDHNFVLYGEPGVLRLVARLHDPGSGRGLEVLTTEPGLQLYTGNFLHGQTGKRGCRYPRNSALCLEAQHYPDAVHHPGFPSVILAPGEEYRQTTVYRFVVD